MESYTGGAKFDCLLFDMDDTLYPLSLGINLVCRKNIQDYMLNKLRIEESQVPKMCLDLYKEYGTTMAGLKVLGYDFNYDEFHACVHGTLPYEKLKPDPVLRQLLLSLPQRKIIFTNSDKAHAATVLKKLGLEDCFEGIICFETLNPSPEEHVYDQKNSDGFTDGSSGTGSDNPSSHKRILCKPSLESMEAVIEIAKLDPKKTVFFDDSARNMASGKAAGFHTVIVGSSVLVPGADVALESIHNIKEALPELWEAGEHVEVVLRSTTVETRGGPTGYAGWAPAYPGAQPQCVVPRPVESEKIPVPRLPNPAWRLRPAVTIRRFVRGPAARESVGLHGCMLHHAVTRRPQLQAALEESAWLGLNQGLAKGVAVGSNGITFAIWAFNVWYGSRLVMYHGYQGGTVFAVSAAIVVGGLALG